jgi:hypothetical protein
MNEDPLGPARGCLYGIFFSVVIVVALGLALIVLAFILE